MDNPGLTQGMFWAGALMAFIPMLFAGIVLWFWWRGKKRQEGPRQGPESRSV